MLRNVTFSKKLYISDSMNIQKLDKLKKSILEKPVLTKVFLITISTNQGEQLDIIESYYLAFPFYRDYPLHIVGLAGSNKEAVGLIEKIVQDCLDTRKDVDLRTFLLEGEA